MAKANVQARDLTAEFYPKLVGELGSRQFCNANGELDEELYYTADPYAEGFAKVKFEKGGKLYYRNLIGEVYYEKLESGKQLYRFFKGEINADGLTECDFGNPKLISFVNMVINLRHAQDFLNAKDEASLKAALDSYSNDPNHAILKEKMLKAKKITEKNKLRLNSKKPKQL